MPHCGMQGCFFVAAALISFQKFYWWRVRDEEKTDTVARLLQNIYL